MKTGVFIGRFQPFHPTLTIDTDQLPVEDACMVLRSFVLGRVRPTMEVRQPQQEVR